ncbi:Mitochondrial cardiolipin hydrolase [Smittium mucronatum]|uniref:Mitochondrial cardiolipin hydrolase n=1 Tax=Smittium mucronatum TaxID=133383 RepID=A0A1R0GZ50_9FUNG|nr:Mitochondrial cardiolipin hydrolase [Smittium mucronatum]
MGDFMSSILSCLGISSNDGGNNSYPVSRPPLTSQQASQLQLHDFINRSIESSPSVMHNKSAFVSIYSSLLANNQIDPGLIARQVEECLARLAPNDVQRGTDSWAIQLIGMAIDASTAANYPPLGANNNNNNNHQNSSYSQALANNNYQPNPAPVITSAPASKSKIYVKPYFFPSETSFNALRNALLDAKSTLDICVFSITDNDIRDAIIKKHQSNVRVRIISDDDQAKTLGSDVLDLRDQYNIPVRFDNMASYMHNKFAVVDSARVITGSYNWSKNARKNNQENIIITNSSEAVNGFSAEFEKLWSQFSNS